jgi:hypothetical protein
VHHGLGVGNRRLCFLFAAKFISIIPGSSHCCFSPPLDCLIYCYIDMYICIMLPHLTHKLLFKSIRLSTRQQQKSSRSIQVTFTRLLSLCPEGWYCFIPLLSVTMKAVLLCFLAPSLDELVSTLLFDRPPWFCMSRNCPWNACYCGVCCVFYPCHT